MMHILAIGLALIAAAEAARPNFVFILTDDQDVQLGSMNTMYGVRRHLIGEGTTLPRHYCTVSLCCPSRVNLWTGKAAHNTNITDLKPPYGGYPKFLKQGWNKKWLFAWLKNGGYQTYFTGKLMNTHNVHNYVDELNELSLDGHDFYLEPGMYQYFNTTLQHQNNAPVQHPNEYTTDLLTNRSLAWIDHAVEMQKGTFYPDSKPFFLAINPIGPHAGLNWTSGKFVVPQGPPRYSSMFMDAQVPRTYNFNPDMPSGASWVRHLPGLNEAQIAVGDYHYAQRLRALQAVDDLVNATIARLDQLGILDNTFIIYSSDNGFHIGQHRMPSGKRCPYEEDVNVPLVVRGPGVPKGVTANYVTSHTDLVPSILAWAGVRADIDFDGNMIPIFGDTVPDAAAFEKASLEFWGHGRDDLPLEQQRPINTYKALRLVGPGYNLFYSVWCDGSNELYDMTTDPGQMHNLIYSTHNLTGVPIPILSNRLDALTAVLKHCAGKSCRTPWIALHPDGAVRSLLDAVHPKFDAFYASHDKVQFKQCTAGYRADNEFPQKVKAFTPPINQSSEGDPTLRRGGEEWEAWHDREQVG